MTASATQAARSGRRDLLRGLAGVGVSVVALGSVVLWASRQDTPTFPSGAGRWALLLVAVGVYAVATLARGYRWHVILRLDGVEHRRRDAYGLVCVGYMGNNVLPARGGEVLRVFLLGQRSSAKRREVLGSIVAERILDAAVLVALFSALTFAGEGDSPGGRATAAIGAGVVAGGLLAGFAYLALRRRGRFARFAATVRPVASASRPLFGPVGAGLAGLTAVVWALEAVIFALVARSLGLGLDVVDGLFLDVLASFFALVPAAPGYVGTFDAAMLFGLGALGVARASRVSFVVLVRFVLFVPITVAGLVLLLAGYGGVGQIARMRPRGDGVS